MRGGGRQRARYITVQRLGRQVGVRLEARPRRQLAHAGALRRVRLEAVAGELVRCRLVGGSAGPRGLRRLRLRRRRRRRGRRAAAAPGRPRGPRARSRRHGGGGGGVPSRQVVHEGHTPQALEPPEVRGVDHEQRLDLDALRRLGTVGKLVFDTAVYV